MCPLEDGAVGPNDLKEHNNAKITWYAILPGEGENSNMP
jgi:hypothetical protein